MLDVGKHAIQPLVLGSQACDLLHDEVGIATDHVHHVVEVVRDPADQLTEALQPLGLLQPPFVALPLGFRPQPVPLGLLRQPAGDIENGR